LTRRVVVNNNEALVIYIGIDPGKHGGIAAVVDAGCVLSVCKMPQTPAGLVDAFRAILSCRAVEGPAWATLERVSASPQMGVVSAFTFGQGYGGLKVALTALGVPFEEVSPVRWQNLMDCRTRGDKNVSKARAQALFPRHTITHAIADALLLAEYGRRLDNIGGLDSNGKEKRREEGQQKPTSRSAKRFGSTQGGRGI
jgi:hypothetical protein